MIETDEERTMRLLRRIPFEDVDTRGVISKAEEYKKEFIAVRVEEIQRLKKKSSSRRNYTDIQLLYLDIERIDHLKEELKDTKLIERQWISQWLAQRGWTGEELLAEMKKREDARHVENARRSEAYTRSKMTK